MGSKKSSPPEQHCLAKDELIVKKSGITKVSCEPPLPTSDVCRPGEKCKTHQIKIFVPKRRRSGKVKSVSWRKSLCDVCPPTQSSTQEISQQVNTNLFTSSPVEISVTGLQHLHVGSSVALSGSSVALSGSSVFSLPESDQQTCQPNCEYLGTSHYSLYPGLLSLESSPEISSSESLPHESTPSSPESSSPESSSP